MRWYQHIFRDTPHICTYSHPRFYARSRSSDGPQLNPTKNAIDPNDMRGGPTNRSFYDYYVVWWPPCWLHSFICVVWCVCAPSSLSETSSLLWQSLWMNRLWPLISRPNRAHYNNDFSLGWGSVCIVRIWCVFFIVLRSSIPWNDIDTRSKTRHKGVEGGGWRRGRIPKSYLIGGISAVSWANNLMGFEILCIWESVWWFFFWNINCWSFIKSRSDHIRCELQMKRWFVYGLDLYIYVYMCMYACILRME